MNLKIIGPQKYQVNVYNNSLQKIFSEKYRFVVQILLLVNIMIQTNLIRFINHDTVPLLFEYP